MSYPLNIGYPKHRLKVSVKHQLVLVCIFMRVLSIFYFSFDRSQSGVTHSLASYIQPRWQLGLALSTSRPVEMNNKLTTIARTI